MGCNRFGLGRFIGAREINSKSFAVIAQVAKILHRFVQLIWRRRRWQRAFMKFLPQPPFNHAPQSFHDIDACWGAGGGLAGFGLLPMRTKNAQMFSSLPIELGLDSRNCQRALILIEFHREPLAFGNFGPGFVADRRTHLLSDFEHPLLPRISSSSRPDDAALSSARRSSAARVE